MIERIVKLDDIVSEELHSAWLEQMARGYQEMGEINLFESNLAPIASSESMNTTENLLKENNEK